MYDSFFIIIRGYKYLSDKERQKKIDDLLDKLYLSMYRERLVRQLGPITSRKLDIAVELLNNPSIILMDEPDSGLDVKSCIEFYKILDTLVKENNSTILVINHNTHMDIKYPYIDDILFLASQGRVCFYGDKNYALEYFNVKEFDEIYKIVEDNEDYYVDKYNKLMKE